MAAPAAARAARFDGLVESIGSHGTLLGVADDPDLSDATVELHPGDSLVLYTDGLTDAYAPARILTPADLVAALEPCGGQPAADIASHVAQTLLGVNGGCIISHGRSTAKAVKNAIRVARDFATSQVDTKIREKIRVLHTREHEILGEP